jgi:hypothetical protein
MNIFKHGCCVAFAASVFGSLGCGAAEVDEPLAQSREAIDISTWGGLVNMATTGSYRLTGNIDGQGRTWTPKAFSGTFEGADYRIYNFKIASGSFFSSLNNSTIRRLKLTDVTITGSSTTGIGGIATSAVNTTISGSLAHATIDVSASSVGGLVGTMTGGSIYRSYAKGSIKGTMFYAGGLVGSANRGSVGPVTISESYAQVTVQPLTPGTVTVAAGGLVGYAYGPIITDVYAVGNVTGRGAVGGIVGHMDCADDAPFQIFKTIYRGDVIDENRRTSGGWAGAIGTFRACAALVAQNFYDRTLDPSSNHTTLSVDGFTSTELRSPTTVTGGVFCAPDVIPERCGDRTWKTPPWDPGTSSQHHVLLNMPILNEQPR